MKILTSSTGVFGPFVSIEKKADHYLCDGGVYPFSVVGTGVIADAPAPDPVTIKPPVPQSVSIFQGKAAMLQLGLLDDVEAYMARPATPALTKLAWREAMRFERSSAMIAQAKADLGWSDEQVDQLFILADTIR